MKNAFRSDLLYPELSYQVVGVLYDVYNQLGHGLAEKVYQNAISVGLKNSKLKFKEQVYEPMTYMGEKIAINYFDFLIEDKLILEIKRGDKFSKSHIEQLYQYLVNKKLKLGILAYFAANSLHFKRIVNIN